MRASNAPVDLVVVRASDVPRFVRDERSRLQAGITGSDILWEEGCGPDAGDELPISSGSTIFVGVTERLRRNVRSKEIRIEDLQNRMVVTKFPNITTEVFEGRGIAVEVFQTPGKTEAVQYVYPDCDGILDVVSTGRTAKENDLTVVENILPVTVRLIDAGEQLTEKDQDILDSFRSRLIKAYD